MAEILQIAIDMHMLHGKIKQLSGSPNTKQTTIVLNLMVARYPLILDPPGIFHRVGHRDLPMYVYR